MKKVWNWVKGILAKLFRRTRHELVAETELPTKEPSKVVPIRFTHNMPKYQPCPEGHGWKKRLVKTFGGANYWCNQCKSSFLVRART